MDKFNNINKFRCKLCNNEFLDDEMSEEHYPARSTGNEDIVLCGVLLKFNDYKALLNMLFYRLNRMEFGRVAFSNANYPLVCLEY